MLSRNSSCLNVKNALVISTSRIEPFAVLLSFLEVARKSRVSRENCFSVTSESFLFIPAYRRSCGITPPMLETCVTAEGLENFMSRG